MRLTKKTGFFNESPLYSIVSEPKEVFVELNKGVQKLGQLEDIEDELGIDLITLFKALKNGIIVCCDNPFGGKRNVFVNLTPDRLSVEYKWKCLRKGKDKFYFKDYGETWALTKEEFTDE